MAKEAQLYELTMVINPNLPEAEVAGVVDVVRSHIETGASGSIEQTSNLGLKKLAYPLQKHMQAHVTSLQFTSLPETLAALSKDIAANHSILRHLLVSWKREAAPRPLLRRSSTPQENRAPETPIQPSSGEEKGKVDEQQLDKKLDEILGGEQTPTV